jgi:signal transduction histidine kinase
MKGGAFLSGWPLTVKVPLLLVGLMVAVALGISQVVLSRLERDQQANLRLLTGAYLDGLSAAVLPAVLRSEVWDTFDALERTRHQYAGVAARYTIIEMPNGEVLAASDPLRFPVHSVLPGDLRHRFSSADGLVIDEQAGRAWLSRTLKQGGFAVGLILAEIDITDLLRIRRDVLLTLIGFNSALTLAFAAVGYFAVRRMLQPLGLLSRYVERARDGRLEPIPERFRRKLAREFSYLFERFNDMARALNERESLAARLAHEERYAMLGKLASGMAHEVNNPLGGMLNAIDTLQAHGADPLARQKSLEFLKRGLAGIQKVVRAALVSYKGNSSAGVLTQGDLDDLPFLVQHETGARHVKLAWENGLNEPVNVDGSAVRQIALNLLLNACAISPPGGTVSVKVSGEADQLSLTVSDEGPGLPEEMGQVLTSRAQFAPPPEGRTGLGIWTTARLIHQLDGKVRVERPAVGTRISVTIPLVREVRFNAVA